VSLPFPGLERKRVSETMEELAVERRGEAQWMVARMMVVGVAALAALALGISTQSRLSIGIVGAVVAVAWGVHELVDRREIGRLREARQRRKEGA
jgi:hypothetical protein